jgi:carbonic anhydrase/acetyltransferase-like protein (isoleucine patch superfamily)
MTGLILPFRDKFPKIDDTAFIAETATIIGDVIIGEESSVWYGVTIRGDVNEMRIGKRSNVQDGTVIHEATNTFGTYIGDDVTVAHMVLLHACTLEDNCFIGMSATVMDGVVVEKGAMVAAGALVTPGKVVKSGQLWAGTPAKYIRDISEAEIEMMNVIAPRYVGLGQEYLAAKNT